MNIKGIRALVEKLLGIHLLRDKFLPEGVRLDYDIRRYLPRFHAEVVFDVGANVGQSARHFLVWFAGAQIFCFEPVEDTFRELRKNMGGHGHQVHCFQMALGASQGNGNMVHRGSPDMFYLARNPEDSRRYDASQLESVNIQTVDAFCQSSDIRRIGFLKIDTEGHDLDVLKGAEGMLSEQRIDMVQVEAAMHPGNTRHVPFEVVKKYLEQRQYFVFAMYEQVREWTERAPHLRRTNPVFISRRVIESNKDVSDT